ncbi:hypothetical protein PMAYCL1PPCAC_15645, partial [Pristionchus mayeri]
RYNVLKFPPPEVLLLICVLIAVYAPTALIFTLEFFAPFFDEEKLRLIMATIQPNYVFDTRAKTEFLIGTTWTGVPLLAMRWVECIIGPVYFVILICFLKIHRHLGSTLKMSQQSIRMHREVIKALSFQALLPSFYLIAAVYIVAKERGIVEEWEQAGHIPSVICLMILAASPLITLFFIRPYRLSVL